MPRPAAGAGGAPPSSADLMVETVTVPEGLDALGADWNDLYDRSASPQNVFQDFTFLNSWARCYLPPDASLFVVVARLAGRVEAIVPLARRRRFGFDLLEVMGAPVAQFDDAIINPRLPEIALDAIRRTIVASRADILLARRVRADAALRRLLRDDITEIDPMQAPHARLSCRVGSDGPGAAYSARDRSNHRRRLRRMAEFGAFSAEDVLPGPEAERLAALAIDMKVAALDGRGLAAPTVRDGRFRDFFIEVASQPRSGLRISAFRLDGETIALDLSFDSKGSTFGHVLAVNPGFEREGLGQLLIQHAFQTAKARGSALFELMAPLDEYKLKHSDGMTDVTTLLMPLSRRGRLLGPALFAHAMPTARAFAKRLPSGLVRTLMRR